jgi:tripartite-type tricarboxylate transporter receptor subunit TctC
MSFRRSKCRMLAAAAFALMLAPWSAGADNWPSRPVTVIVPFPAGSGTDLLARAVASELSDRLGQQFVVDNRGGAGGNIGAAAVAKANPDGYTILFGTPGPLVNNKLMYKNLTFDSERDFMPIVLIARSPLIIVATPATPANTLQELMAYAKANPGKLNVGHPGNGTLGHITSELLQSRSDTKITQVPYRGSTPLATDLLGGQVNVGMDFMPTYVPLVTEGKLRALAVTSTERASQLPNVPTVQESGFGGFEATAWYALAAPTGTPTDVITKINAVVNAYLQSAGGKQRLDQLGMQAVGGTPNDLKAYMASEFAKWAPIIRGANIAM